MLLLTRGAICCPQFLHICCQKSHLLQNVRPELSQLLCRTKVIISQRPQRFRPQHENDKVNKDYSIIYINSLANTSFYAQLFIYSMSVPTMAFSAYQCYLHYEDIPYNLSSTSPAFGGLIYFLFSGFLVLGLNTICRRSIYRMYHNPDTDHFIAIVQNWYMAKSHLPFTAEQARRRKPSLKNGFLGNLEIKGRQFFIVGTDFKIPAYYNRLMGFDLDTPLEQIDDIDIKDLIKKMKKKPQK